MNRRASQTAALVALLQSLPDDQLQDVLTSLNGRGVVVLDATPAEKTARHRPCGVCGQGYPKCRRLWSLDHEYEPPAPTPKEPA